MEVVFFELPEVVLGLGVHEAEDGVGVGFAVDVGDSVGVAINGDGWLRGLGGGGEEEKEGGKDDAVRGDRSLTVAALIGADAALEFRHG